MDWSASAVAEEMTSVKRIFPNCVKFTKYYNRYVFDKGITWLKELIMHDMSILLEQQSLAYCHSLESY